MTTTAAGQPPASCDTTPGMVTVAAARDHLLKATTAVSELWELPLEQALGRVLASPVHAGVDVPPADNSAMDGYALHTADLAAAGGSLPVSRRIPAGVPGGTLAPGTAARIFTGAEIPDGADAVVMQERCTLAAEQVTVEGEVHAGDNIRRAGEDLRRDSTILAAGRCLRPQDLGLAASTGVAHLTVFRPVRVAILCTGDELVAPGQPLTPGQIYNSNETLLTALLQSLGCEVLPPRHVEDTPEATREALQTLAAEADLVISSGGVSVGDEDHVKGAVDSLGALDLWRVAVKPGKPLAFGRIGETLFLGLPGNPVSLFVTFLLFGIPLLRRLQGREQLCTETVQLPAGFARERAIKREEYLRVRVTDGRLEPYPHQGSGVLSSAAWADGLARIPAGTTVAKGDLIEYFSFPALLS